MKNTIQGAFASRTMRFAAALATLSVVEANLGVLTPYMTKDTLGLVGMGVAIAIAVLRVITTQPLSTRASAPSSDTTTQ